MDWLEYGMPTVWFTFSAAENYLSNSHAHNNEVYIGDELAKA